MRGHSAGPCGSHLLLARVRQGTLTLRQLELAAYCQDAAALAALGQDRAGAESFESWFEGVFAWGRSAAVQALAAVSAPEDETLIVVASWLVGCEGEEMRAAQRLATLGVLRHRAAEDGAEVRRAISTRLIGWAIGES